MIYQQKCFKLFFCSGIFEFICLDLCHYDRRSNVCKTFEKKMVIKNNFTIEMAKI